MDLRRTVVAALSLSMITASCAGTPPPAKRPASYPLPAVKKDCATCHTSAAGRTTAALKKELAVLCLDCHADRVAPEEHRVGITPSSAPEKLPLSSGKMTCITCHDPHTNGYGALLRMPETELCLACHPY